VKRNSQRPRSAGRLVLRERVIDEQGGIIELIIWQVPKSTDYPEGIRYGVRTCLEERGSLQFYTMSIGARRITGTLKERKARTSSTQ